MIYFSTKSDLEFLRNFLKDVEAFLRADGAELRSQSVSKVNDELKWVRICRQRIARGTPRAKRIARQVGAPTDLISYPAPAVGGPMVDVNTIDAILTNDGHQKLPNQRKIDVLEQAIGALEEKVSREFYQLINPFYWASKVLTLTLRLPFIVLETAGFSPESFEKSLAGKVIRLIEVLVIGAGLVYLGFNREEVKALVMQWLQ